MPIEQTREVETPTETEVSYVVPPPAYESIDTEHELAIEEPVHLVSASPAEAGLETALTTLAREMTTKLDGLQAQFDREVRAESAREKIIDRLHAELQDYKNGLLLGILRPVFVDLIQLHDDIGKMVDATESVDGEVARLVSVMQGFQQGVVDILYRQGVEPYHVEDDVFDPRRQRAITTLTTDHAELNKRVATRHRPGFMAADKLIRPEVVTVYAFKKQS